VTGVAKEEAIEVEGIVEEILPGAQFRVRIEGDRLVLAYTAGKMRNNRIRTAVGDRVTIEITPYDLTRGRLVFRHRGGAPPAPGRQPYRPDDEANVHPVLSGEGPLSGGEVEYANDPKRTLALTVSCPIRRRCP
jgi:translation initiation factor IF-1